MNSNLTDKLVREIEKKIVTEEWPIGSQLPTLREMVSLFSVSRSVINSAIKELDSMGYLCIIPRKKIIIANWRKSGTLAVLSAIIRENAFDRNTLKALLDSRKLVETECVRLAATNATAEDLEVLSYLLEEGKTLTTIDDLVRYDFSFHHALSVASGNMVYPLIIKAFEENSNIFVKIFYQDNSVLKYVLDKHSEIINSLKKSDEASAVEQMEALLSHGEKVIFELLEK